MGNIPCICIGAKNQRTDVNRRRCALHRATVCLPLRNRATVTEVDVCGETALHSVVTDGSDICVECVNLLIRHHADINVRDRNCRSPLHYAVDDKKIEWVKLLLEHGADVNSGDFYYATPLLHAVEYKNPECVQVLLQYNADVNACNAFKFTPLECAVSRNNVECVKLLLEHGAKTNICDNETPLYSAVSYNNVECVKLLLQHGVDVNVCVRYNGTPLHCAVDYDKIVNRCKRFLQHGANRHACGVYNKYKSIRKNYVECVKLLLQQGAKLDVIDCEHNTALNVAARYCHLEIINLLLEYNANVNTKNLQGQTPLMQAALKVSELNTENNVACLELLIQASGQFDLCNEYNELILKIAHVKKIGEILLPYCVHPRSLQDLCRYQIRSSLHQQFLPDVIPSLNLPNKLQRFLLLQR